MARRSPTPKADVEKNDVIPPRLVEALGDSLRAEFLRDAHKYEEGQCPEFAIALSRRLPGSTLSVCTRSWEEFGGTVENRLSHVVVELPSNHNFDAGGMWASERWEERWEGDYSDKPDEDVSFSWETVTEKRLASLVGKHRESSPSVNFALVEKLGIRRLDRLLAIRRSV